MDTDEASCAEASCSPPYGGAYAILAVAAAGGNPARWWSTGLAALDIATARRGE